LVEGAEESNTEWLRENWCVIHCFLVYFLRLGLNKVFLDTFQAEALTKRTEIYPQSAPLTVVSEGEFFGAIAGEGLAHLSLNFT
jgi:hypothetical protein